MIMHQKKMLPLLLCAIFTFSGCSTQTQQQPENKHFASTFAMDTIMEMTIYDENGEQLLTDAEQEIRRLERLFSVTMEDSEITKLNQNAGIAPVPISDDTLDLLQTAQQVQQQTNGSYDMTVAPIVQAWGFTKEAHHVPSQEELSQLLPLVQAKNVEVSADAKTAYLTQSGMSIDLGGIAKGYTSDAVSTLLKNSGVTSALLWLGGNISVIGNKPDGNPWKIAVENPQDQSDYVGLLEVSDCSVITSGGYQRYFEQDGKRYHHIIDPATGYPSQSDLLSVTIVSENGTKADALSTALFVMGLEDALTFWRESNDFEAVFVTTDNQVVATEGLQDCFAFEGQDNDYTYTIANRTP